jgi:2-keto-myo-inositol isomerase
MKIALNGATTMRADLLTDMRAAHAARFDYLEIWSAKLREFLTYSSTLDLMELFLQSGVRPLSINSIEHITFRDSENYEAIKQECAQLSEIANEIDCPMIVVVPGRFPNGGTSRSEIVEETVRVLTELSRIAAAHDVRLAFEFLGQRDCTVQTLDLAHEIVQRVDRPNVGLVIDSFHFYAGGSNVQMIENLDPKLLYIFHINDAEDRPREELQDCHRLLPGLGILPLNEILKAFRKIGYDKVASVEIFRPEYWDRDPFVLAREAIAATRRVISTGQEER